MTITNTQVIDLHTEKKDPALRDVMAWIQNGCRDDNTCASFERRKFHYHLSRLQVEKGILTRQFFDDFSVSRMHSKTFVTKSNFENSQLTDRWPHRKCPNGPEVA